MNIIKKGVCAINNENLEIETENLKSGSLCTTNHEKLKLTMTGVNSKNNNENLGEKELTESQFSVDSLDSDSNRFSVAELRKVFDKK